MGARHRPASSLGQSRARPARYTLLFRPVYEPGGADDVGNRIPGADLVEGNGLEGFSVYGCFRVCEQFEDCQCVTLDRWPQSTARDDVPDFMDMPVLMGVVTSCFLAGGFRWGRAYLEPRAFQHAISVWLKRNHGDAGQAGLAKIRHQAVVPFGKGIQQGSREHVARHAADRI